MGAVTVYDGKFERSLAAGKSPLASFGPIDRFGLTLGRGIPKRIKRAPGRGTLLDFLRIETTTHRTHSPDRGFRTPRSALFVERLQLGRDVGLSPIHRSAPSAGRDSPFDQPDDAGADHIGQYGPRLNNCGKFGMIRCLCSAFCSARRFTMWVIYS